MAEQYPQLALFGAPPQRDTVIMPRLPAKVQWRQHTAHSGERCDYCLLVRHQRRDEGALVRRATWTRTGTDAATLLLCDGHAARVCTQ